jgi:hypothetical protein
MSDELDALLEQAGEHARRVLVEMKEATLMPVFLMIGPEDNILMPAPWRDDDEKRFMLAAARDIMKDKRIVRYSVVSEAWSAIQPKDWKRGMPEGPAPSERPDRKEIVIAIAADKTTAKSRAWDIVRGEGGSIVDLRRDEDVVSQGGRMAELLR